MKSGKKLRQILFPLLFLLPLLIPLLVDNQYYVHGILCRILIYTIFVASLDIVVGYIGDISIGHAGLFAIGAYAVAILTGPANLNTEGSLAFLPQIPFIWALLIGVALAAIAGLLLGFPSLRSSGPYLAVTTIAYGLIIYTIINEQETLTNGTKGIHVSHLSFGDFAFTGNRFFYIVYPCALAVMWIMRGFQKSFWGRAFEAIKYSGLAAESCGINRNYFKISAFVISAAIAGFAGGLFAQLDQYIAPGTFSLDFSILALMALIFGGLRSNLGNFIGMALVVILPDVFTAFADYRLLAFGILLLLTLFFLPGGVASLLRAGWAKFFGRRDEEAERLEIEAQVKILAQAEPGLPFKSSAVPGTDVLSLDRARMQFGGLVAVNDLEMKINAGRIHGLMGPNGSGKSTTLATKLKIYERAKRGVARTFQNLQLFSELTVLENVMVGLHLSFRSRLWQIMLGLPSVWKEERKMRLQAYRLLQFVGLEKNAFVQARHLPYGQARRLEIARALALNPGLLLLDEPAAGLTSSEIEEFNEMIRKIKSQGIAILLIEHHMDMLMEVSEDITVLDFGKRIATGSPQQVQADPNVVKAYLGTEAVPAGLAGH